MVGFLKHNAISLFVLVLVLATSHTQIAQAVDSVVDGNLVFTGPGQGGAKDIRTSNTEGGLRIYNGTNLSPIPTGAAIQFFGNGSNSYPGQAFIDAGANDNGAIIFRTAKTGQGITERMRVDASGNITATGNFSTTGIINIPQGIQRYTTPGAFIFTVPAGVNKALVQLWGAGGGGGGCVSCVLDDGGGGGGGGAVQALLDVSPGDVLNISVGTGGLGGADGVSGATGGTTSVIFASTVLTAGGGAPGGDATILGNGSGGAGGVASATATSAVTVNGLPGNRGGGAGSEGGKPNADGGTFRPGSVGVGGKGFQTTGDLTNGNDGLVVVQW